MEAVFFTSLQVIRKVPLYISPIEQEIPLHQCSPLLDLAFVDRSPKVYKLRDPCLLQDCDSLEISRDTKKGFHRIDATL